MRSAIVRYLFPICDCVRPQRSGPAWRSTCRGYWSGPGFPDPTLYPGAHQTPGPQKPAAQGGASVSAQELANQVNNPAAPVTFIQFRKILIPSFPGFKGALNSL